MLAEPTDKKVEDQRRKQKEYYYRTKSVRKVVSARYYLKNKEAIKQRNKKWASKNMIKIVAKSKRFKEKAMKQWSAIIPSKTLCQACGKEIWFNKKDITKAIHFDHRHDGKELIREESPRRWLTSNLPNEKNILIWKQSDFGMLCRYCNFTLPTKNRKIHVLGILKYVFGKEYIIKE